MTLWRARGYAATEEIYIEAETVGGATEVFQRLARNNQIDIPEEPRINLLSIEKDPYQTLPTKSVYCEKAPKYLRIIIPKGKQ